MSSHVDKIDQVDPGKRRAQLALAAALWESLLQQGVRARDIGLIDCVFFAPGPEQAQRLAAMLGDRDSTLTIAAGGPPGFSHTGRYTSIPVHLTSEALLGLTEVALVAALESGCELSGLEVDTRHVTAVRPAAPKPWWRFWG